MNEMDLTELEKTAAARAAVAYVTHGMRVGLGSGSTVAYAIHALGERARAGLDIVCATASRESERLAVAAGIPLVTTTVPLSLDLVIDGADEVASDLALIKGGGGALLHEKILASVAKRFVVIADHRKRVDVLGDFGLPIEVIKTAWPIVARRVAELGGAAKLRSAGALRDEPAATYLTDEGNYILDCAFGPIRDPATLARALDGITGVVEHGLFVDLADEVIIATGATVEVLRSGST